MLAEVEEQTAKLTKAGEKYFEFGKVNWEFEYHQELSKMSTIPEETKYLYYWLIYSKLLLFFTI